MCVKCPNCGQKLDHKLNIIRVPRKALEKAFFPNSRRYMCLKCDTKFFKLAFFKKRKKKFIDQSRVIAKWQNQS